MKKTGKRIIGIVVLLLIVVLLQGSMVSTYNDEYKLVLQFGKVVRVVETPGLSFKIPFLQTTQSIPNYEMIYDLIPSEVNTRDKKVMVTDSFALWSVTDPLAYLSRLGANKANAESRISVVVYNAVKNVIDRGQHLRAAPEVFVKLDLLVRPLLFFIGLIFLHKKLRSRQTEFIDALLHITYHETVVTTLFFPGDSA